MTHIASPLVHRALFLAATGAALTLVACGGAVTAGGGSGGSGGGGGDDCPGADCTTVSTSVGQGGAAVSTSVGQGGANPTGGGVSSDAIAMLFSELPTSSGSGTSGSSGSGVPPIDPSRLEVFIGGQSFACGDPFSLDCGGQWMVSFSLPVAYQQPGLYSLSDPELNSFASETGTEPGPDCSFGGGSFWEGTVEIISIDATQVVGRLANTDTIWSFNSDGDFTAPRCF